MHEPPVSTPALARADAPGCAAERLAAPGAAPLPLPPTLPQHAEVIRRLNTTYLLAARDAAQHSIPYTIAAFGVPPTFADWLATAAVDAILDLAAMPVCLFALRLPPRAIERTHHGRRHPPAAGGSALVALHTALAGRRPEEP